MEEAGVQSVIILGGRRCIRLELKTEQADFFIKKFQNEYLLKSFA